MAQEPRTEERHPAGEQPRQPVPPQANPQDMSPEDQIMAIRKAAGSIAEVFDNPQMAPTRVRIG